MHQGSHSRLSISKNEDQRITEMVSGAWSKANHVAENVRLLNSTFQTNVVRTSYTSIADQLTLLLITLQTNVQITLALHEHSYKNGIEVTVVPKAQVIYGEQVQVVGVSDLVSD